MSVPSYPGNSSFIGLPVAPPSVVSTIGVHGSASTWIFNVVRELLITALGQEKLLVAFAGGVRTMPTEGELSGRHFLLKSHSGSVELDEWLADHQARLFLSVRDPRDAAVSMVRRFNRTLPDAIRMIVSDSIRIIRLEGKGHRLFRYEDQFFERQETVHEIADALAVKPGQLDADRIFACYTRDAVRALAASLVDPHSDGSAQHAGDVSDPVTHIHRTHIGDGTSGKWHGLPAAERNDLNRLLRPIIEHFGYPVD